MFRATSRHVLTLILLYRHSGLSHIRHELLEVLTRLLRLIRLADLGK